MIDLTSVAETDTTITAMFLLVEVLAGLQVYHGVPPTTAIKQVRHLVASKVVALRDSTPGQSDTMGAAPIPVPSLANAALH